MHSWHLRWPGKSGSSKDLDMKSIVLLIILCSLTVFVQAQKVKNDFFALHNIIRGDSVYNTFDKQVQLVKAAGFDGIEINQVDSFDGMKSALDMYHFKGSYFYVKVKLEEPSIDPRLKGYIEALEGSGTIIAPYIVDESKQYKTRSSEADDLAIRLVREIGKWAENADLQVAIYPHLAYYVERTDHALALVKRIARPNVGLTFNLCHWLATTSKEERPLLKEHLKELKPFLKMITVSGANEVTSDKKNVWEDYILPLGEGSFNTYGLIKYCIRDLKLAIPIGVQCYNIKGDKVQLVNNTVKVWKQYKAQLESGK